MLSKHDHRSRRSPRDRDQLEHQIDTLRHELRGLIKARGRSHPDAVALTERIQEIEVQWASANKRVLAAKNAIWDADHAADRA